MKLSHIALIAWKTFRHNSDKSALYLEISTVFCLSLCVGIILGLNAIFSDLMLKSVALSALHSPLVMTELKDEQSIYNLHLGLSQKDKKTIESWKVEGLELTQSERNIVIDESHNYFIVMPTDSQGVCMTPKETHSFTVYDISEGRNALGLPMSMASFRCEWKPSAIALIQVPRKSWNRVYGDKKFVYSAKFTNLKNPVESIMALSRLAQDNHFTVINKSLTGLDFIRISLLQKKIFDIVFSLLCVLLMALMIMNCMIFIKNRKDDWKLFYLFKVSRTGYIVVMRFFFIFILTVISSFIIGLVVANVSTDVVRKYLLNGLADINLSYHFEAQDILFTYGLVGIIFILSTLITMRGIYRGKKLKSIATENFFIQNLSRSYHTLTQGNVQILKNIDLTPLPERLTAIVGVSGSGKTTLLNSIFSNAYLGEEVCLNIDNTAYVTQYPNLIQELSIRQNLAIFSSSDQMEQWCEDFGIVKILDNYPSETSVGEKQRACMVRALLSGAKNLVLDEPTASLDKSNKILVIEIIKKLIHNKILKYVLVVTHDPVIIEMCDDVYQLDNMNLIKVDNHIK